MLDQCHPKSKCGATETSLVDSSVTIRYFPKNNLLLINVFLKHKWLFLLQNDFCFDGINRISIIRALVTRLTQNVTLGV